MKKRGFLSDYGATGIRKAEEWITVQYNQGCGFDSDLMFDVTFFQYRIFQVLTAEIQGSYTGHDLHGGLLKVAPHLRWLASCGPDGNLLVRALGTPVGKLLNFPA